MSDEIIDMHVHFGAPRNDENDCYWSDKFERTPAYFFMKITSGSLFRKITHKKILKKLLKAINTAKKVDKVVLLAMDKVFDKNGNELDDETHLYVPNSYIIKLAKENKRILLGASIHPYRSDWEDELEYCMSNNAKLCKWIPSSQQIDPEDDKCIPFYQKLVEYKLPLLVHSGPEYAIPTSNDSFNEKNNPKYLRRALDAGVTVIIAHCSLPYFGFLDWNYFDDLEEFYKLFEEAEHKNWNLYSDLSAITTLLRNHYVEDIRKKIPHSRLLFGSDYPIPASEFSYKKYKNIVKWIRLLWEAFNIRNPIDKNYFLIKKMGFDSCIYTNAANIFGRIKKV